MRLTITILSLIKKKTPITILRKQRTNKCNFFKKNNQINATLVTRKCGFRAKKGKLQTKMGLMGFSDYVA